MPRRQIRFGTGDAQTIGLRVAPSHPLNAAAVPVTAGSDGARATIRTVAGRPPPAAAAGAYDDLPAAYDAARRMLYVSIVLPPAHFAAGAGFTAAFTWRLAADGLAAPEPARTAVVRFDVVRAPIEPVLTAEALYAREPLLAEHAYTRDPERLYALIETAFERLLGRIEAARPDGFAADAADTTTLAPVHEAFALAAAFRAVGDEVRARTRDNEGLGLLHAALTGDDAAFAPGALLR